MKLRTILFLIVNVIVLSFPVENLIAQDVTTVFLVRHAEKMDDSSDPELSEAGKFRAKSLTALLEKAAIEAVYTTDYIRTRETCKPSAELREMDFEIYNPREFSQLDDMVTKNKGKTILVCGHSNSIPRSANYLLKNEAFNDFDESDYGNIIIVSIPTTGIPTHTLLRY